jgi:hypothetical protein
MVRRIFLIFPVLLIFASCKDDQLSGPDWRIPYEIWRSKNIHNYSIDQVRYCFCMSSGDSVRITVRADTISNIINIEDNSVVTNPYYYTIDSLFGIIQYSEYDSIVIKYNSTYGYPKFMDINPQYHPVDGGVLYETGNLQIQ